MRVHHPGRLLTLLACVGLSGCGSVSGVMLAGNIVSAAGAAAVDASRDSRREEGDAVRARGMQQYLAELGAEQGIAGDELAFGRLLTEQRDPDAFHWMCQAAMAGLPDAQLQLGHWYNEDRLREDLWPFIDARPDNATARAWYSAAASNGEGLALIYLATLPPTPGEVVHTGTAASAELAGLNALPDCSRSIWVTAPRASMARDDG